MNPADQLPRVFQVNIERFYQRVVAMVLDQLPLHGRLATGEAGNLDEFLTRCAEQVDNHTAFEAAKAFALILDGQFERQLCRWAQAQGAQPRSMETALPACARIAGLDLDAIGLADDLKELHLVANVVRHGDGRSCTELQVLAPSLWNAGAIDYVDLAPGWTPASEMMRIRAEDLRRYARAIIRFWGHADPLPMAVTDPP